MKEIRYFVIKVLAFCLLITPLAWADSPLTSTQFYQSYSEYPLVVKAYEQQDKNLPKSTMNF